MARCPKCKSESYGVGDSISISVDIHGYSPCTVNMEVNGAPVVHRSKVFDSAREALEFCVGVLYTPPEKIVPLPIEEAEDDFGDLV